jgi:hypothetical protein
MTEIVTITLPFFGLILLGYGSGRRGFVSPSGLTGLDFFTAYLALPALFFRLVAATRYADFPDWSFVLTTTFATYCAFAIAFSCGALFNRGNVPEATMQGVVGSSANIGRMGPGLVVAALGAAAGAAMALVFTFDFALLAVLAPLMMVLGGTERPRVAAMATGIAREIFRQPLVIATILGFLAALIRLRLPGAIDGLLAALAAAAAPTALFALGLDLARRRVVKAGPGVGVLVGIKLAVHPFIVYLLLSWIGGFNGTWVNAAILMAALPPGVAVVAAAQKYRSYVEQASVAVLIGTAASIVTLTVALALILDGGLPIDPFH